MALLEVAGVHAGYGGAPVLHDVSLSVEEGEIAALLGPNGAGKTTTLRCVSGLIRPTAGSVKLEGQELVGRNAEDIVSLGVAHAPEGRGVFPALSVEENLRLGGYIKRQDHQRFDANLEMVFGYFPILAERRGQQAGTLSGGEQQMLAIARALMSSPRLLVIDEASLGLAPIIVHRLFKIVEEINKAGTTVLMVEQNAKFALAIAHRAFVMQKGTIIFSGTGKELEAAGVAEAYLGVVSSANGGRSNGRARGGRKGTARKRT